MAAPSLEDRFTGCLLGLMVGDALGSHFEGQSPEWIGRRYPSRQVLIENPPDSPWHYTDDTQMAIGVAEALLRNGEIVEQTLCDAFVSNYVPHRGYGRGARIVIEAMQDGRDYRAIAEKMFPGGSFGNGAAMRVAPVGLFFHADPDRLWEQAGLSARPTHVHPLGIEGAQVLAMAVALCMTEPRLAPAELCGALRQRCRTSDFHQRLETAGEARTTTDLLPLGNGIAAQDSVVTAIACFTLFPDSYGDAVATAVLLGGDTDTIAAMAGAISGASLGLGAIPSELLDRVEDDVKGRSYVEDLGRKLCSVAS